MSYFLLEVEQFYGAHIPVTVLAFCEVVVPVRLCRASWKMAHAGSVCTRGRDVMSQGCELVVVVNDSKTIVVAAERVIRIGRTYGK
jgi:hypothetical protein